MFPVHGEQCYNTDMLYNWIIQLIGLIGTGLYLASYQFKKNRTLFIMQGGSYCFYFLHYYLLGATTAAYSIIINFIRSALLGSNNKWAKSKYACALLCALQLVVLKITWIGWISLLPCIANIASTIGGYTYNPQKIRSANMFVNSPLFIIYAVIVGSWAGVIDELISEASMIISVVRFGWKNLDEHQD